MTKKIVLPSGDICLIDDVDYEWAISYKWHKDHNGYARRGVWSGRKNKAQWFFMHQEIMKTTRKGKWCDHINGNRLDNRRSNLRLSTSSQNLGNRKLSKNSSTGYKGVCFDKKYKKYKASIMCQGKRISLKYFSDPVEAAKAYDAKARELFGEFARTNFERLT